MHNRECSQTPWIEKGVHCQQHAFVKLALPTSRFKNERNQINVSVGFDLIHSLLQNHGWMRAKYLYPSVNTKKPSFDFLRGTTRAPSCRQQACARGPTEAIAQRLNKRSMHASGISVQRAFCAQGHQCSCYFFFTIWPHHAGQRVCMLHSQASYVIDCLIYDWVVT